MIYKGFSVSFAMHILPAKNEISSIAPIKYIIAFVLNELFFYPILVQANQKKCNTVQGGRYYISGCMLNIQY